MSRITLFQPDRQPLSFDPSERSLVTGRVSLFEGAGR